MRDAKEIAMEHVNLILEQTRQDIEALNAATVDLDPETRIKSIGAQIEHAGRSMMLLRDAGVSFKEVLEGGGKDVFLVSEVNRAFRYTLIDHGVELEAIEEAIEASIEVFRKWKFPVDV